MVARIFKKKYMPPKYYFGNYPGSPNYDPNLPPGWNHWDAEEVYDGNDIRDDKDDWEEEPEEKEEENELKTQQ